MGITIEYSIKYLTAVKKTYTVDTEVLSIAIDTMRKYQKIEQIYEEWNKPNHFSYNNAMQAIGEVLNGDE